MSSCLYKCLVMHNRLEPKPHRFHYNIFMFYVDLDEIGMLDKKLKLFSHNRFNFFSFREREHLQLPVDNPDKTKTTKQHIIDYVTGHGVNYNGERIMLLTNMNVLGYNFNPVSFYFCLDKNNEPLWSIVEITNTFLEMKPYFIGKELFTEKGFHLNTKKYFYISPFIGHDTNLDFRLQIPDDKLNMKVDDYKDEKRFFISTLTGTKKTLSNANLLWYSLRFPFITLRIITLIHWHALLLWMKKLPYHAKAANQDLQRDVYRKYRK